MKIANGSSSRMCVDGDKRLQYTRRQMEIAERRHALSTMHTPISPEEEAMMTPIEDMVIFTTNRLTTRTFSVAQGDTPLEEMLVPLADLEPPVHAEREKKRRRIYIQPSPPPEH